MKRIVTHLVVLSVLAVGCSEEPPPVDQVQTNLVDKEIFAGDWWYSSTIVDVQFDEAAIFAETTPWSPFEGSMSSDFGLDFNRSGPSVIGSPFYSFPIARIRWVIDEDFLFAFRSFELVQGGNDDADAAGFRGQPIAAFKIEAHVDIRQDYSGLTGEETNVRVENTSDRRWFERELMRVDWSQNLLTAFVANDAQANDFFSGLRRESTPFFIQEGVDGYPDSYAPQFVRVSEDEDYRYLQEWPEDERDAVHYMSFVTQETWSPGGSCLRTGAVCASAAVTMRNAFLRVPPEHEYAVETMSHTEFDRFGIFRSHQPTYARGGRDRAELRIHCFDDSDCGPGGACDQDESICVGGLTEDRGETDFLTFYASRQNLYADSLRDEECASDWECDGRYFGCDGVEDQEGCEERLIEMQGSACDPAAGRCTIPLRDRPIRRVEYRLNPGFPAYLVRPTIEAVAQWNEVLMRGQRSVKGLLGIDQYACDEDEESRFESDESLHDGICTVDLVREALIDCQTNNPAAYCYCGSPEEDGGSCARRYDPFESPDAARERGVPNPYDCHVEGPDDESHPEAYGDYAAEDHYGYRFVGDECLLTVVPNSCDIDPEAPCEELGDLRHQFITLVEHGAVPFGGVAQPLSDPTSGELVVSNASASRESLESVGTLASQFLPVLRGDRSEDEYFTGENLRGYYSRLGRVEHPVSTAPSGSDVYTPDDPSRPASSYATEGDRLQELLDRAERLGPRLEQLQGNEGRAAILSDRMVELEGSELESRLMSSIAADADPTGGASAEPKSLREQSPLKAVLEERERRQAMASLNRDDFSERLFNSQYWEYWAEAFDGYSLAEASLRLQQRYYNSIMTHEVGHALGLRHNFAGSLDRDNYHDAYYRIAREVPLPSFLDYDNPDLGGDGDDDVTGPEAQRWAADLRQARQERLQAGIGNVMTSSVMDYDGDLSGFAGVGRYDAAATLFSYFRKVEATSLREAYSEIDFSVYDDLPVSLEDIQNTYLSQIDPQDPERLVSGATSLFGLKYADSYRRELWTYYRGGQTCKSHGECPHSAGSETTIYQPITQRCVNNGRTPNTTGDCGDGGCICSNFYDDFDAYVDGRAYRSSRGIPDYEPVDYLYCHDNRADDLSWCTTFDAGESFQEVVDHYRLGWRQAYPRRYFRNFRLSGPAKGYSFGSVVDAVKIYQHFFFRYNYEPEFRQNRGPLGQNDQLLASADVLNWLGEIMAAPDVGSYVFDDATGMYEQISSDPGAPGSELDLEPGQGFYLWSEYQEGLNGFYRLERAGTFLDKILAVEAVARRDWGLSFTLDERYYVNFYDLFQQEVIDLFGGLILREPRAYAPRVSFDGDGEPLLTYLSSFRDGDRGSNADTYPDPAINGTDSEAIRDSAALWALASFPIYYDTSFEQRLLVFKTGSGDGYDIPAVRTDGQPTCGYGEAGCDRPDFITYDSDRLHITYMAVVIQENLDEGIDEQQLGYQLLLKLRQNQDRARALEALAEPTAGEQAELADLKVEIQRDESFVEYLIDLSRSFGITPFLF